MCGGGESKKKYSLGKLGERVEMSEWGRYSSEEAAVKVFGLRTSTSVEVIEDTKKLCLCELYLSMLTELEIKTEKFLAFIY